MALPEDLLAQAKHLASKEPKKPKQASLRRAVSAAYYALFHLLTLAGAQALSPARPSRLEARIKRAFTHADINEICKQLQKGQVPQSLDGLMVSPLEAELRTIAEAFVELQQARHTADYDMDEAFDRADVLQKLGMVERAFAAWKTVRSTPNANVFLAALLLNRRWRTGG